MIHSHIIKALIMGAFLLLGGAVWAQTGATSAAPVGDAELKFLEIFLTRNYGLAIGLGVAILGIFKITQNDTSTGIILIIVGACITFAPGILNGVRLFVCPITAALGQNIQC